MDQIADLLSRIKNSVLVQKHNIILPHSKTKEAILNILKNEGFIDSFEVVEEDAKKNLKIAISISKTPTHLKLISKPGRRIYAKNKEIPAPLRGLGTVVISTSKGIISGRDAKKSGLGGELICEIW